MGSTYLSLTNRLLRRQNEVEISQSDFPGVRNIQSTAKDAIQDSVRFINNHRSNWPFNTASGTQLLVVGQEVYPWPVDFLKADWESFQITKDDSLSINSKNLRLIPRELWYNRFRDLDDDSESTGRSAPDYIFPAHGENWGLTPSPDKAYTVTYKYFNIPDDLSAYDDTTTIPTRFDYVIITKALSYMSVFKGDAEATAHSDKMATMYLRDMVNQLLPNDDRIYTTEVNFGGGQRGDYIWTGR